MRERFRGSPYRSGRSGASLHSYLCLRSVTASQRLCTRITPRSARRPCYACAPAAPCSSVRAASSLGITVNPGLVFTGLVALVASFVAAQLRARWLRFLVFLLAALAMLGSNWGSPADFAKQLLAQMIVLAAYVFGVRRVMKF